MNYPHLAARLFNTPLLIHPQKLDAIIAGLGERLLGSGLELGPGIDKALALPAEMFSTRRAAARGDTGYGITDGVAVISASGALVHRSRMDGNSSYLLGYNELALQVEDAQNNPDVHAILQVMDTPGGEVSGAFEYSDRIHALRGKKPMWAIADSLAASAGYLGGSAFDQLAVAATGYVGSIGVVMRHVDMSRKLANDGVQVTHIFAGDHKIDGNPYEPLPASVRADLQAEIDSLYTLFVDAVVRNRGLNAQAVRNTQANTYRGQAAVSLGLADRVATTDQLITELAGMRRRSFQVGQTARATANDKGVSMSGTTPSGQQAAPTAPAVTAPSVTTAPEANQDSYTRAELEEHRAKAWAAGAAAERQRIADVRAQSLPGHEALVERLAFDGVTTGAQAAVAVLGAERERITAQGTALRNEAPQPLALVPGATVTKPEGKAMSRADLDAAAKQYQADHPGTSYFDAYKAVGGK